MCILQEPKIHLAPLQMISMFDKSLLGRQQGMVHHIVKYKNETCYFFRIILSKIMKGFFFPISFSVRSQGCLKSLQNHNTNLDLFQLGCFQRKTPRYCHSSLVIVMLQKLRQFKICLYFTYSLETQNINRWRLGDVH